MARSDSGFSPPQTGNTGKRHLRVLGSVALLALAFAPGASWALFSDRVELWAAENVTHDSNVFRLSPSRDPRSIGVLKLSDTISTTSLGATLDLPVSQQRLQAAYTWFASRYRDFSDLNFNGHAARAAWLWSVQQTLTGTASYTESQGLASFSNIQNRTPDLVATRQALFSAAWLATPRWRASGSITATQQKHGDLARRVNDIEAASTEVGLSYITPQDNSFGGVVRVERGRLPHGTSLLGAPFDNAYTHRGAGATMTWSVTGHSRFDGRVEWVRRTYEQVTQRNFDGATARATYTWTPTGKLTILTAAQRDIAPIQDINALFVLLTGASVRPRWALSDKLTLQGTLEYNVWDYRGDPLTGANWTHRVRTEGVSALYRPTQKILLQGGLLHEARSSTLLYGDYVVNVVFVEGRIGF